MSSAIRRRQSSFKRSRESVGKSSASVASQTTEYDTRDQILNRVVTVTAGVPSGFQAAATTWDVSSLATAWGAP